MADKKLSELTSAISVGDSDLLYLVQGPNMKKLTASRLFSSLSNVTLNGNVRVSTDQTLSLPGPVTSSSVVTKLRSLGSTGVLTLPVGSEGQIKILSMEAATGGGQYTITSGLAGNVTITFNKVGHTATLLYQSNAWYIIGGTANITMP